MKRCQVRFQETPNQWRYQEAVEPINILTGIAWTCNMLPEQQGSSLLALQLSSGPCTEQSDVHRNEFVLPAEIWKIKWLTLTNF